MKKLTAERCKKQIEEWQRMMSVSDVAVMVELNLQAYVIALPVLEQQEKQAEQQVDTDGWIEWKGGECPVDGGVMVETIWSDGDIISNRARKLGWHHSQREVNIISYRVVEQERDPNQSGEQ